MSSTPDPRDAWQLAADAATPARDRRCPEPDGRRMVYLKLPRHPLARASAHAVMIRDTGQCPWCGTVA